MAANGYVLKDFKLYMDGYNLSGWHDRLRLGITCAEQRCTASGHTAMARLGGIRDVMVEHSGFWQADSANLEIDDILSPALGVADKVLTVCPMTGAAGEVAYFTKGINLRYQHGGAVGGMYPFSGAAFGQDVPAIRGTVLQNGAVGATGAGTARQLGAVAAGKKIYAALHCIATTGSGDRALTVKVQSCPTSGFASSVTDRITFSDINTAVGAQFAAPVDGAITDEYWRLSWTAIGTGISFNIIGSAGIL